MDKAVEPWLRRRRVAPQIKKPSAATLIEALKSNPAAFKDRKVYLCAYSEGLTSAGKQTLSEVKNQTRHSNATPASPEKLDAFQWPELPNFADLVCFYFDSRGGVSFDGYYQMPEERQEILCKDKTKLQLCWKVDSIDGFSDADIGNGWRPALASFKARWKREDTGKFLDLGEFAAQYLL